MSIVVTTGQCGDSPQFEPVLEKVRVPRIGWGRPRVRPDRVRADKAYASRRNRAHLRRPGPVAPPRTGPTRCATSGSLAPAAAGRRVPTRSTTGIVMRSSAGSIASRGIVPSPRDTTSPRSATRRPYSSLRRRVAVTPGRHVRDPRSTTAARSLVGTAPDGSPRPVLDLNLG
ncbi:hypothetical protein ACFVS9_08345 [Streptomyces sp. NPDC058008]|uniref:hypothetical protein n=1 Tax=Streptomyces sp. NPDC058008 TaxID=3346303 RepID=UPI0036E76D05